MSLCANASGSILHTVWVCRVWGRVFTFILFFQPMQVPGMGVPIKRQALDAAKGGIPMFNPAAYQQLYAPQQPAYVPVSCKYSTMYCRYYILQILCNADIIYCRYYILQILYTACIIYCIYYILQIDTGAFYSLHFMPLTFYQTQTSNIVVVFGQQLRCPQRCLVVVVIQALGPSTATTK